MSRSTKFFSAADIAAHTIVELFDLCLILVDNIRVVRLNALDIVLDLALNTALADAHVEQIAQECFKFCILREGAVHAVFVLNGYLLASLSDHHAV